MNLVIVDTLCAIVAVAGVVIVLKGAKAGQRPGGVQFDSENPAPATYITRIFGVIIATFALALAAMVTAFSLAGG
jgi:hypothetical protein